tara:strand:- start:85469 stop:85852 length:384 start_codon:yes stop_codon:yes gene_type:complete
MSSLVQRIEKSEHLKNIKPSNPRHAIAQVNQQIKEELSAFLNVCVSNPESQNWSVIEVKNVTKCNAYLSVLVPQMKDVDFRQATASRLASEVSASCKELLLAHKIKVSVALYNASLRVIKFRIQALS